MGRILRLHLFHVLQTLSPPPTWTWGCRRAGCTARHTGGTCSGTSCSCCRT
ncbi:hypothetical protein ACFQV4_24895 [Streptomyces thermocarboxydus]